MTTFDHLVKLAGDGGLDDLDVAWLVGFMQDFEQTRNRLSLLDHCTIYCGRTARSGHCFVPRQHAADADLGVEPVERRKRRAGCGRRKPSDPACRCSPQCWRGGAGRPPSTRSTRCGFDPADIATGEALLTEHAAVFPPEDLRLLAHRFVDAIDPDGTVPNDQVNTDRRYFHLRPTRDAAYVGDFRLTGSLGPN